MYIYIPYISSPFISSPVFPFCFTFLLFASLLISKLPSELAEQKWSGKCLIGREKKGRKNSFTHAQKVIYFCRWKFWKIIKIFTSPSLLLILRIIFKKLYHDLKVRVLYIDMVWSYTDFKIKHCYNGLLLAMLIKILRFLAHWPHIPSVQYTEVLIILLILLSFSWQAFIWNFPIRALLCWTTPYMLFLSIWHIVPAFSDPSAEPSCLPADQHFYPTCLQTDWGSIWSPYPNHW